MEQIAKRKEMLGHINRKSLDNWKLALSEEQRELFLQQLFRNWTASKDWLFG